MSDGVAILGSTGSIGCYTLQVLARQRERFRVVALTAHSNAELLDRQAAEWQPAYVGLVNGGKRGSGPGTRGSGTSCLVEAATHPDVRIVVNGIVGAAGLEATLAALRAGKRVALANKETLVMAGELVTRAAREGGGEIVPVDSEHSAVLQCLAGRSPRDGGFAASDVEDGEEDHGGLCHPRQQGARGDRGALPVRPAVRRRRGGGAPPIGGARIRRVRGRLGPGTGRVPHHGAAHPLRPDSSRAGAGCG